MTEPQLILVSAALLGAGVFASLVAGRVRMPALVVLLATGMLVGSDGLG